MIAFFLYILNVAICLYGLSVFVWWWSKTGKATNMYAYVTLLFAAALIEKSAHLWSGYILVFKNDHKSFVDIILSPTWYLASIPTLTIFSLMMFSMTKRIYKTYIATGQEPENIRPVRSSRNVLVISNVKKTHSFLRGFFITNGVDYHQASTIVRGFDLLVATESVSVVMVGLKAIEESGMKAEDVAKIIKQKNPWCIVVAMSREPNIFELYESRRAFFDDYAYLPIRGEILMFMYERWLARINRWRRIDRRDRRSTVGEVINRKGIIVRDKSNNQQENKGDEL